MIGVKRGFLEKFFSRKTYVDSALALKAALSSPVFTGTPTAPTPTGGDNSTKLATTAYANLMAGGAVVPAKSIAANGYFKLANGLIIQWGRLLRNTSANQNVTYPIAFPSSNPPSLATSWQTSSNVASFINTINNSKTGFTVLSSGYGTDYYVSWIAIGY